MPAASPSLRWGVVVPVKRLDVAKSRLAAYGERARRDLALAFAADVVAAAAACPVVEQVLVVTDDAQAAQLLRSLGARIAPDDPDAGLNPALEHGVELLRAGHPDLGVATLSSDLPALRPDDLTAVLGRVTAGGRAFVADASGTGTTLLAAAAPAPLGASYGPGSRERHRASGALEVDAPAGLRHDVDTPDDLRDAVALGVGARTAAVVAALQEPAAG